VPSIDWKGSGSLGFEGSDDGAGTGGAAQAAVEFSTARAGAAAVTGPPGARLDGAVAVGARAAHERRANDAPRTTKERRGIAVLGADEPR
jgi:hypothetical protein